LKFEKLSEAYLGQARERLDTAARALKRKSYAYCVRLSQEAVEMSTKALLRSMGVEYPKFHDTAPALRAVREKLPTGEAEFLAGASESLTRKRALAMYGDEARKMTPDEIFGKKDAEEALQLAKRVFKTCRHLAMTRDRR
jgi:HEPN domain-containing protein